MEVIDKRTEAASFDFMDVKRGIPFEYDGDLFIKTYEGYSKDDVFMNAVSLKTGMLYKFDDNKKVILVDANVTIN